MRERPLSPHLSVYRFKYTLTTSIANRITGLVLSLGMPLLVYWLVAVASGPEAYARAALALAHPLARVVYAVLLIAFCYHLLAGLRHLVWDTGHGLEREQSQRSAWGIGIGTLLLVLVVGYFAFFAAPGGR